MAYTADNPRPGAGIMTITQWEKDEWSRFARAAYADKRNDVGHLFSVAASLPDRSTVSIASYDALMAQYRRWLCFNKY